MAGGQCFAEERLVKGEGADRPAVLRPAGHGQKHGWRSSVCWPSSQATWVRMAGAPARISSPAKVPFIKVVMRLRSYAREGSASFRQVHVHTLVDNCPRSVSPHVESFGARGRLLRTGSHYNYNRCDRPGAKDYAAFLGFFSLELSKSSCLEWHSEIP